MREAEAMRVGTGARDAVRPGGMTKGAWGANADEGGDCGGGETGDEEEEVEVESGAASGRRPMGTMERSCFAGRSGSAG